MTTPIHCLAVGASGSGKTTLAATFPKPMLVHFWDGFGNDQPFLDQGEPGPLEAYEDGTPWREVQCEDGGIIVLEYYHDLDPTKPTAFLRYLTSLSVLSPADWQTVIFDSASEAVKSARWWEQFAGNPTAKGQAKMQWWGESADKIERILCGAFKSLPCHTVVTAHLADRITREDAPFWPIDLPGRLSTSLPRAFSEVYTMRIVTDDQGARRRVLQTECDETYFAKTHLKLPFFVDPYFDNLWKGEQQDDLNIQKVEKPRRRRAVPKS